MYIILNTSVPAVNGIGSTAILELVVVGGAIVFVGAEVVDRVRKAYRRVRPPQSGRLHLYRLKVAISCTLWLFLGACALAHIGGV